MSYTVDLGITPNGNRAGVVMPDGTLVLLAGEPTPYPGTGWWVWLLPR